MVYECEQAPEWSDKMVFESSSGCFPGDSEVVLGDLTAVAISCGRPNKGLSKISSS